MIGAVVMRSPHLLPALVLASALTAQESPPPVDFAREVRPVLMERCVRCHGARRHEADLRLDRRRHVFAGKPDSWVVVPGEPDDSLLLELVCLPAEDPDRMPGEGEPLTPDQLELLRRWIAQGADWPEAIDAAADAADARRRAAAYLEVPELEGDALQAELDALAQLVGLGARAQRIAANTLAIEVDVSRIAATFDDTQLEALRSLAPRLCWLRLSGAPITERGAEVLTGFTALRRLDLSGTAIDSSAVARLAVLPELRDLDLHDTATDNAAIDALAKLPRLERIHLWRTAVTKTGIERLRAARPELSIEHGAGADRLREPHASTPSSSDAAHREH